MVAKPSKAAKSRMADRRRKYHAKAKNWCVCVVRDGTTGTVVAKNRAPRREEEERKNNCEDGRTGPGPGEATKSQRTKHSGIAEGGTADNNPPEEVAWGAMSANVVVRRSARGMAELLKLMWQ